MGPTTYLHPRADLGIIKKVAVIPFDNLSRDQFAGDKVREIFISELLATGGFDVMEPGEVTKVLREQGIASVKSLGPAEVKKIGKALNAQAIILGSVNEYGEVRSGAITAPEVSLSLRMLEVESGQIVWSVSHTEGGIGVMARLFGLGESTLSETTRKLVRIQIGTLFK